MSYNSFDYYQQLRQYQLHMQKLSNPETSVPTHEAFKPPKAHIDRLKEFERQQRILAIQRQNQAIMNKLVQINRRKPQHTQSQASLSLPPIKKQKAIPLFEQQNSKIAQKIISTKSSIDTLGHLQRYKSLQARKRNISKYLSQDGMVIDRKKYLAELMLLKKMRVSEVLARH